MSKAALTDTELRKALVDVALSALDVSLGTTRVFEQPVLLERLFPLPSRQTRRFKGRVDAALARLDAFDENPATPFQRRLLQETLARSGWVNGFHRRLDRLLRRPAPPAAVLDPARRAIAASVWSEPGFCRVVSTRIYRRLRDEVLMSPSGAGIPALAPDFWWVLIGTLADASPLGTALREAAVETSARPGWAGFWEQYLLLRLRRNRVDLPGRAADLPLIVQEAGALHPPPGQPADMDALREDWRKGCPDWAGSLISGRL